MALKVGKHEANTRVERSLYQKPVGYDYPAVKIFMPAGAKKPVYAPYVEHVPPDVTACIFWLKNRDPAHWRDAWQVDHTLGKYHRATKFSRCFDGGSELRPAVDGVGALARLVLLESSGDGEALRLREGGDRASSTCSPRWRRRNGRSSRSGPRQASPQPGGVA